MQIKFIGTGGAFDVEYGNSSAWIEYKGKNILLDCGFSIYSKLVEHDLIHKIDYILITHLHDDHAGSLATTLLHRKHKSKVNKPIELLCPNKAFQGLVHRFFSFTLLEPLKYFEYASLNDFDGIEAIETTGFHKEDMASFAYLFKEPERLTVYSGDLGNPNPLFKVLAKRQETNIRVFHDVNFQDTNGVHTHYKDLHRYLDEYEIYGYHHNPKNAPSDNKVPLITQFPQFIL